jgi:hypothetical protein
VSHNPTPGASPDAGAGAAGLVYSLHPGRSAASVHPAAARSKPDRFLVGVVAGVAIFYLLGRALGLGRRREDHAEP